MEDLNDRFTAEMRTHLHHIRVNLYSTMSASLQTLVEAAACSADAMADAHGAGCGKKEAAHSITQVVAAASVMALLQLSVTTLGAVFDSSQSLGRPHRKKLFQELLDAAFAAYPEFPETKVTSLADWN